MIKRKEFYQINYFEYGEAFYGSHGGMRFRIARSPQKNVHFDNSPDKNKEAFLECVIWRGPLAYSKTREEKQTEKFAFDETGADELTKWLNEQYESRKSYWERM